MDPIIKVKQLNVTYQKGTPSELPALKGVELEIYPEEFLIIFGPSGCGKSTLLYSISGAEQEIEAGDIFFKGQNIRAMDKNEATMFHRQSVGLIFQAHNLIPTLSVLANVTLPLVFLGMEKEERKKRGLEILERFGIKALANKIPSELSGGQQQRTGIARALINNPDVVLADEPTGNLDSAAAINVLDTLKELNEKFKKTVVLVTHEGQYLPYAHRVVFMKDGKVVNQVQQREQRGSDGKVVSGKVALATKDADYDKQAAKALDYLGLSGASEEYLSMQTLVSKYLSRAISKEQVLEELHKPVREGGFGMYKQRAERVAGDLQEIAEISAVIEGIKNDTEAVVAVKVIYLTDWLLKESKGHFNPEQKNRIAEFITQRISEKINHQRFQEMLDCPFEQGGVGLNSHTAHNLAKKLEDVV